jgi:integrase
MAHTVNLYKVKDTYYFRCRIPVDLKTLFQGSEDFKRSLRTKSLVQARKQLKVWSYRTEYVFSMMRSGMLTREQIQRIAEDWKHETLQNLEWIREAGYSPTDGEALDLQLEQEGDFEAEAREALAHNDFTRIDRDVRSLLEENAPGVAVGSPEYGALARAILQKLVEVHQVEQQRMVGNYQNGYDDRPEASTRPVTAPKSAVSLTPNPSPSLTEVINKYIAALRLQGNADDRTVGEYEHPCRFFAKVMKDKAIATVTRDDVREFLSILKRWPKHATKKEEYRGKSIEEILQMNPTDTLGATTIYKHIARLSGFMGWAVREEYILKNPTEGQVPAKKDRMAKDSEEPSAFDTDDLRRMVDGWLEEHKAGKLKDHPERLWVPLISLYGGQRLNEVCQLHIQDIKQDKATGVWFFDVEETEDDDKKLKTAASRRRVPIHPELIDLGFLEYFQRMKEGGHPRLFMNLNKTSRGYHRKFSYWFLGGQRCPAFLRLYVTQDPKKNFHSFRHSLTTALKGQLVSGTVINEIIGHAHGNLAHDRYGDQLPMAVLQEHLAGVRYEVDLEPLREILQSL